jgi:DNA polymerase-3 subunit alpha
MMLQFEKDVLGFYVTSNPLSKHAKMIDIYSSANTARLNSKSQGREVIIGGMIMKIRHMVTKNGRNAGAKMAVFELEDLQGKVEVVMFPKKLEQYAELVEVDKVLFVKGKVDCQRETPNILCDELISMEEMAEKFAARVSIEMLTMDVSPEKIERVKHLCRTHRGKSPVHVNVQTTSGYRIVTVADKAMNVRADVDFCTKMEKVVGRGNVKLMRN